MNRILLAGATGYLGSYIVKELKNKNYYTSVIVRNKKKLELLNIQADNVIEASITDKEKINGCCKDIDVVISTIGITKQKDGLTYLDVDYQANKNLLDDAVKNGVKKFIFISVLNAEKMRDVQVCYAKEKFSDKLRSSGLDYCIIKPNGFFSDLTEFLKMAQNGRVYLLGDGKLKSNPIHGKDLAEFCVNQITSQDKEVEVGGPEIFTQQEIAEQAFAVIDKKSKITLIPDWIRKTVLSISKLILPKAKFGPIEFFLNVMAMDMVAPKYGSSTLLEFYKKEKDNLK